MYPEGIDDKAPVVSRHSRLITAPLDVVWRLHTDVEAWPTWQPAIDETCLTGPFAPGATFTWRTYNLTITSTVYRVEPRHRTLWGGPSEGITGIHAWASTPTDRGVRVETEESWSGVPVLADPAGLQNALDASLTAWLDHLASAAQDPRADV